MTLRRTALGGILAVLVSAMAVGPALAARLWTLTATPLTFPAGAATAVTLTVTDVGGSGGGDEITCVTVDVPSTFTVSGVSIVSIKRQTSGHGWIAMTTAISGGTRITIKEPTDKNPLVGLPLADQAIFRVSGTASALGTLIWSGAAADKPGPAGSAACGSGTFPGLTVSLIVTALLPTPAPTPTPTPTPSPTPTPTPSPTPTPTPTPKPTPAPTPTPTPTPRPTVPPSAVPTLPIPTASLPIPIPSLPIPTASLSVPSIPPLVSLPPLSSLAPSPTSGFPEASPSTDPAGSPTGSANPTPSASTGADGGAAGPTGGGSGGPGVPPGVGGEAGPAVIPVIHDAFTIPGTSSGQGAFDNFDLARTSLASLDAFVWALPAFGLTVPGMLLVVVVLAQAGAGAAWLPVARRKLGVFGFGRSRRGARRAA